MRKTLVLLLMFLLLVPQAYAAEDSTELDFCADGQVYSIYASYTVEEDVTDVTVTFADHVKSYAYANFVNGKLWVSIASVDAIDLSKPVGWVTAKDAEGQEVAPTLEFASLKYNGKAAKSEHVYEAVVTPPTCEDAGYTTCTCSICGKSYVDHEVAALGHSYNDGEITTAPTCTENGVKTFTCQRDGTHTRTETIYASGHKDEAPADYRCDVCGTNLCDSHTPETVLGYAATCEKDGLTDGSKCSKCGEVITAQETIPAKGHDYDEGVITTQPGCETTGVKTFTCGNDSKHTYTETVAATGHSYAGEVTTPTCTEQGYTTYTCGNCGGSYVADYVDATDHSWNSGSITTPATCTENGVKTFICQHDSKHTRTEVVPATGHADTDQDYVCDTCGEDLCTDHDPQTVFGYAATCEKSGLTDGSKCAKCGDTITAQTAIPATGHAYDNGVVTTQPGCETVGVKTFTCQNDKSHTYTEDVAPTGHNYTAKVTAPTCTAEGYTTYTCGNCGDRYESDRKEALSHQYWTKFNWMSDFSAATATAVCDGCGDEQELACMVTCHWDQISGKLKFTATAALNSETVTDNSQFVYLRYSDGKLTVTNSAAEAGEKVDMIIMVAGYSGGRMNGCQVIEDVTGVMEIDLTATGESVKVFFLRPGTHAPLFECAEL